MTTPEDAAAETVVAMGGSVTCWCGEVTVVRVPDGRAGVILRGEPVIYMTFSDAMQAIRWARRPQGKPRVGAVARPPVHGSGCARVFT